MSYELRINEGILTAKNVGGYQPPEGFGSFLLLGPLGGDEGDRGAQQGKPDDGLHDLEIRDR